MRKIAIFNVGGALSAYADIDNFKYLMDIGAGNGFSPVNDFLLPLFNARYPDRTSKHQIDQLLLSHLDNDHISDFKGFDESFHPTLLTVPNDHPSIPEELRLSRANIPINENVEMILDRMRSRTPGFHPASPDYENPLAVCDASSMALFYIPPKHCQELDRVSDSDYPNYRNNVSLILYVRINDSSILFTGDMMKDGMEYLISSNDEFRHVLGESGVDFLVSPHHGLDTSFPNSLFQEIRGGKVKLNIISEKKNIKAETDNRHNVDTRYYSPDFSTGVDVLNGQAGKQYGIITSRGHIVIDFDIPNMPLVKRISSNEDLITEFL